MQSIKITEDLITILALDSYKRDLYDLLGSLDVNDEAYVPLLDMYNMAEIVYGKKIKNVPQYEKILKDYIPNQGRPYEPSGQTKTPGISPIPEEST